MCVCVGGGVRKLVGKRKFISEKSKTCHQETPNRMTSVYHKNAQKRVEIIDIECELLSFLGKRFVYLMADFINPFGSPQSRVPKSLRTPDNFSSRQKKLV